MPGVHYVAFEKVPRFDVHRSHLPLIPGGAEVLARCSNAMRTHEARAALASASDLILRVNQQTALDFIEPRRGVLLGDEQRLGKTLSALLAHDPARGPLLVVAPLSTRSVWLEWMRKLWPDIEPAVIAGTTLDEETLRAPILFGHYDILTYHRLGSLRPGTLIVDEAHMMSNAKSNRTKAIYFFSSIAWRVILLTGTPLWNTSKGLWALLAAVNSHAWGTQFAFSQRYCSPQLTEYGWRYEGASHEAEWHARRSETLLARSWEDVAADLPPTQWSTELVCLDADDQLKVDQIAYELRRNDTAPMIEAMNYYRQATGMFKVSIAVDYAKQVIAAGRDIVIWIWHRKVGEAVARALRKLGITVMLVTGDISTEAQRTAMIDAWKAHDGAAALVISISVGQVGIDLSRAHHALFVEISWNPVELSQAAMRTFSARRPMEITFTMIDHELEQRLLAAVTTKVMRGASFGTLAAGSTFQIPSATANLDDVQLLAEFARAIAA